jgi:hypothetical protein
MLDRRARLSPVDGVQRRYLAGCVPLGILRTAVACTACTALFVICAAVPAPAPAEPTAPATSPGPAPSAAPATSATIVPSLSPDRLGARAALTFTIDFAGGELGVPAPVQRAVLKLPAGLSLDIPVLRSCSEARLQISGPSGCPPQSQIGTGNAVAEAYLGTQLTVESVTLWAFLGPLRNLQPTVEIFGEGYAPLGEQVTLTATALANRAPYGEGLAISVPPLPTVPFGANASILRFSLVIGSPKRRGASAMLVPTHCPADGFPFAAEFTYAGGATCNALATVPCPR